MVERNIIMGKAGGTAGKNSINYKISLPAEMVKELGVTQDDKSVLVSFDDGKIIVLSDEASKSDERKGEYGMLEVLDEMAISEKEMKLLMNFVKDDLKEARDSEDVEKKNKKIDRVLEHIQQYLED